MSISATFFALVVILALVITLIAPVALMLFWIKDWRNNELW